MIPCSASLSQSLFPFQADTVEAEPIDEATENTQIALEHLHSKVSPYFCILNQAIYIKLRVHPMTQHLFANNSSTILCKCRFIIIILSKLPFLAFIYYVIHTLKLIHCSYFSIYFTLIISAVWYANKYLQKRYCNVQNSTDDALLNRTDTSGCMAMVSLGQVNFGAPRMQCVPINCREM